MTVLFGVLGVHKFMDGRIGMGLLYLFTAGLFCIGVAYDIVMELVQLVRMFSY
ncbi:MAG: TM2 domain-containing protein [Firmicutes bacterium]|nr:TM2 domain-containing protein [Bacillota bacterium]